MTYSPANTAFDHAPNGVCFNGFQPNPQGPIAPVEGLCSRADFLLVPRFMSILLSSLQRET